MSLYDLAAWAVALLGVIFVTLFISGVLLMALEVL